MRAPLVFAALLFVSPPALAINWMPPCPRPSTSTPHPPANPELVAARHAERQACAGDLVRFCGTVPAGCGRPMVCLRSHAGELSADCADALAQLRAATHPQ